MSWLMSRTTSANVSEIRGNFSDIYKCFVLQHCIFAPNLPHGALLQLKQNHIYNTTRCRNQAERAALCSSPVSFQPAGKSEVKSTRCACRRRGRPPPGCLLAAAILQSCSPAATCTTVVLFCADRAVTRNLRVNARSGTSSLVCRHSEGRRWRPQTSRQRCVPSAASEPLWSHWSWRTPRIPDGKRHFNKPSLAPAGRCQRKRI